MINVPPPPPPPRFYLVVDLEATTSHDGALPKEEMETIEIGAVLVRADDYTWLSEMQTFVRPVRHPQLLPFCTELTTITQAMVDGAPLFPEAMALFAEKMPLADPEVRFCSWGQFDKLLFERDAAYHGIPYAMPAHMNLKKLFSKAQKKRERFQLHKALEMAGITLEGTHHRGIDDARNTAKLLPWIFSSEDRRVAP